MVSRGMGGLIIWTMDYDDFTGGVCGQGEYPLLTAINSAITQPSESPLFNRLVGLVVKASASRAEYPGFESRLRRDFFGVESYQ